MSNNFNISSFDENKNYIIEASAGTGKTYNIIEIVKKLVNEKNENLNEILIVTYTEKAAEELKNRIRSGIKNENVDVDNAPIFTIHSFCKSIIKEYGLTAQLPLNLNVIGKEELKKFTSRYVREGEILEDITLIYNALSDLESSKSPKNLNIDDIEKAFIDAVSLYYLNKSDEEDEKIINLNNNEYDKVLDFIRDIRSLTFDDICKKYHEIGEYHTILRESEDDKFREFANDEIIEKYKKYFQYDGSYRNKKPSKKVTETQVEAFDYFRKIKIFFQSSFNQVIIKILVYKYLKDFYINWQKEKEINKNQDFNDMIRYVREALINDNGLKEKLQNKYKRAIIDEFQDTNQKQFDIFSLIFTEDDKHKIIVVGDPKQSIYSFQGSDVNVYYKAVDLIEKLKDKDRAIIGEKTKLNKNYRSTKEIIQSCNLLFNEYNFNGTTFENCRYLGIDPEDEKYHEVKYDGIKSEACWIAVANEELADNEELVEDSEIDCDLNNDEISEVEEALDNNRYGSINENEFAEIVVQQIIDCCKVNKLGETKLQIKHKDSEKFDNVSFKDFTILYKDKREIWPFIDALKKAGIPYSRYKDKALFLGKECIDWICLLNALKVTDFTGYNRRILKKALFTNFFGLSMEILNSDYANKDDIEQVKQINKWKSFVMTRHWEDLFDSIILESNLRANLNDLTGIQTFGKYKQISEYCVDYLSEGHTLDELINDLMNGSMSNSGDEDNASVSTIERTTDFDCVQFITMHSSKGLQFPVVIVAGGYKPPLDIGYAYTYHSKDEKTGASKQILTLGKNEHVLFEELEELKRLFYVAYTRAEFILILPNYEEYISDIYDSQLLKILPDTYQPTSFIKKSLERFLDQDEVSYKIIQNNETMTYDYIKNEVKKILGRKKKDDDGTTEEDQKKFLKTLPKKFKTKPSYKHSYTSLSHSKKNEIEDEDLDFDDKEGQISDSTIDFDKTSISIESNYNDLIEPIIMSDDFPKGKKIGTALHSIFEGLDFSNYQEYIDVKIKNEFEKLGMLLKEEWLKDIRNMITNVLEADLPIVHGCKKEDGSFKLNSIAIDDKKDEVEFDFNVSKEKLRNYCNGSVDMIFRRGEYYSIVDWKSDKLSDKFESYCIMDSIKYHVDELYSIQRVLYSYCLIKSLKFKYSDLKYKEIFEQHFGGIYYIFLRGCNKDTGNGIYCQTWNSWEDLEKAFYRICKIKFGG